MSNLAFLLETTDRVLLPLEAAPGDSGGGGGSSAGNGAGPDLAEAGRWYREALAAGEATAGAGLGRVAKGFQKQRTKHQRQRQSMRQQRSRPADEDR
jgi:hypothetical protein